MDIWPAAFGRITVEETDSTQAEAARRIEAGQALPFWVLARRQVAGVGRRGRAWSMPEGNFAGSVALRPGGPLARRALRSFTMALALRDALVELTGQPALFSLKWPNDVLCRERKLAGILLESRGDALVIGIGVNLVAAPPQAALEEGALAPVDLATAAGIRVTPEALLDLMAAAFARREALLVSEGFDAQRREWLAHAARLGQPIVARLADRTLTGRFDGVDGEGALMLATPGGIQRLPAADVHFA